MMAPISGFMLEAIIAPVFNEVVTWHVNGIKELELLDGISIMVLSGFSRSEFNES